ncbi:MAG TPA: SLBB domain-containing protein [Nitrospirota bacterium]|jgi:polysaccharide export outer membrane protein
MNFITAAMCLLMVLAAPFLVHAQDYRLGEGDLIKVTVYENPDLTTSARIGGDGKVTLPLAGEVKVSGLTVREIEEKVTKLLSDGYLVNPQVTVFVEEYHSNKATILGEVNKPGLYELAGNITILEIISKAGGLTVNAGDTAFVKHKNPDSQVNSSQEINLKQLMEKGDLSSNIQIQDGDSIFVPTAGLVYVTGEVKNPGAYKVEKGMTVMKAITMAGGPTDVAAPGRTELIRKSDGKEKTYRVEMGDPVIPDDVISVPESYF